MTAWFLDPQGRVRGGWKALAFLLLYLGLGSLVALAARFSGIEQDLGPWSAALIAAAASLACVRLEGRSFLGLGLLPRPRWLLECLAGMLAGLLLILAMALAVRALDGVHWTRTQGVGARQALAGAWVYAGVAFHEELATRGYPFQRLVEGAGPWVAQLAFAGLFAYAHWDNPGMAGTTRMWATLNIGLAAILLGFCYLRTGSLALPIGVHLGWNWAQGSLLGFGVSGTSEGRGLWEPVFHGRPEWLTGGAFGLEAGLPCTVVCSLAILALWRWRGTLSGGASTVSVS